MATTLRQRLEALAAKHSQSEIARKVGVGQSTVSKYLRGMKVPFDFAVALVREFGVNPTWLMTGEGSQYLSEITAETADTGRDMLGLVRAMNAIAKKRLGALLGDEHGLRLRELDEALSAYELARGELNKRLTPLYRKLLDDYLNAIKLQEQDRAGTLRNSLLQIKRFCDDPQLHALFKDLDAYYHLFTGDPDEGLNIRRELVLNRLFNHTEFSDAALADVSDLIRAMMSAGYLEAAWRMCQGAAAFLPNEAERGVNWVRLNLDMANIEIGSGRLFAGLDRLHRYQPFAPDELWKSQTRGALLRGHYYSGARSVEELRQLPVVDYYLWANYGFIALWTRDPELIERSLRFPHDPARPITPVLLPATLKAYLEAKNGRAVAALKEFREFVTRHDSALKATGNHRGAFWASVGEATITGYTRNRKAFREAVLESERRLQRIPTTTDPGLPWAASHYRNALDAASDKESSQDFKTLRARARSFFNDWHAKGYACFEEYADSERRHT